MIYIKRNKIYFNSNNYFLSKYIILFFNINLELSDFYKFIHMSQISTAVLNSKFVAIYHTL